MKYVIHHGDCLEVLRATFDNSVDAIVTDPPYGLSFMGKKWDYDVPSVEVWAECLRVLKPGGHLLAFAGTRTQHRMACRIEDAGFEIRDMIAWVYGSGFPKSLDVSKAIDAADRIGFRRDRALRFTAFMRSTGLSAATINAATGTFMASHYLTDGEQPSVATEELFACLRPLITIPIPEEIEELVRLRTVESENLKRRPVVGTKVGVDTSVYRLGMPGQDGTARREFEVTSAHTAAARQWQGWGTALKPALEPVTVARKPLDGTVAANVTAWGVGGLNIDGCRVGDDGGCAGAGAGAGAGARVYGSRLNGPFAQPVPGLGRWPANLIHDGSDEVLAAFPQAPGQSGAVTGNEPSSKTNGVYGQFNGRPATQPRGDAGSAARFFYCAKASKSDRGPANNHPTVKPTDLMRYLCRLVTPPGGVVLDPFAGSGSTGKAAVLEGFQFIGIEREAEYVEIARARIAAAARGDS